MKWMIEAVNVTSKLGEEMTAGCLRGDFGGGLATGGGGLATGGGGLATGGGGLATGGGGLATGGGGLGLGGYQKAAVVQNAMMHSSQYT